jgi:Holliday junction resolvasome RuvABC endonuclease subunit
MRTCSLLAVDPSLTCTGWAAFALPRGVLYGVGKVRSIPAAFPLAKRLEDLQRQIAGLFESLNLSSGDILICEAETTMRDPRAAFKVERVRGIFESLARSRSVCVPGRLNPRTVQYEVMGLGGRQPERKSVKEAAVRVVSSVYSSQLKKLGFDVSEDNLRRNQDIVDAILVGSLGTTKIIAAEQAGMALERAFQLDTDLKYRGRRRA